MKNLFYLIIGGMLFMACEGQVKPITTEKIGDHLVTTVRLNEPCDSVRLKLSSLVQDIKTVHLETNDSCMLGNASYLVGEKYILAFSSDVIIMFDSNGKYLRRLAVAGRGLGEFGYLETKIMNKAETMLLALDFMTSFIHCWSLPDGKYSSIPLAEKNAFSMKLVNDKMLQIANKRSASVKYQLYTQNFEGTVLSGILNQREGGGNWFRPSSDLYQAEDTLYCIPHFSDSLYQVSSDSLLLKYIFPLNKNQRVKILKMDREQLLVAVSNITRCSGEEFIYKGKINGKALEWYSTYYLVDIPKQKIVYCDDLQNDYWSMDDFIGHLDFQENGITHCEYTASELTTTIPQVLKEKNLDAATRRRLEQLSAEILEDDNPILIIGKSKPICWQ